ncbi:8868_t:CDS:2, partial [Racocetra persica]
MVTNLKEPDTETGNQNGCVIVLVEMLHLETAIETPNEEPFTIWQIRRCRPALGMDLTLKFRGTNGELFPIITYTSEKHADTQQRLVNLCGRPPVPYCCIALHRNHCRVLMTNDNKNICQFIVM